MMMKMKMMKMMNDLEENDAKIQEVMIEKLDDEFDYNKLKVSELKAISKRKG